VPEVPPLGGQHRREQREDQQERVPVDVDVAEVQRQPAGYQRLDRRDDGPFHRVDELRDVGADDPGEVDADVPDDAVYRQHPGQQADGSGRHPQASGQIGCRGPEPLSADDDRKREGQHERENRDDLQEDGEYTHR